MINDEGELVGMDEIIKAEDSHDSKLMRSKSGQLDEYRLQHTDTY